MFRLGIFNLFKSFLCLQLKICLFWPLFATKSNSLFMVSYEKVSWHFNLVWQISVVSKINLKLRIYIHIPKSIRKYLFDVFVCKHLIFSSWDGNCILPKMCDYKVVLYITISTFTSFRTYDQRLATRTTSNSCTCITKCH